MLLSWVYCPQVLRHVVLYDQTLTHWREGVRHVLCDKWNGDRIEPGAMRDRWDSSGSFFPRSYSHPAVGSRANMKVTLGLAP